jgi:flagellin-like protein
MDKNFSASENLKTKKDIYENMIKRKEVRGLSPVIATVLLIVIVIAIALIVFIWIRGMIGDSVTKFNGRNIELVCDEVSFQASYSDGTLYISNPGNVPIFGMSVKVVGDGTHITEDLRVKSSLWPEAGLNQGGTFEDALIFNGEEITLYPILLGDSDQGRKTYVCDKNEEYGYTILI